MPSTESLVDLHDASIMEDKDDLDSLPSISTSDIYSDTSDSDAQAEWERSLEQLQLILTMLVVPWMGKYFGRKFAYWSRSPMTSTTPMKKITNEVLPRLVAIHGVGAQCRHPMDK